MSHVSWDEANIGEIEKNKPVRQKITEPKTPYHPMIDDDEEDDDSTSSIVRGKSFQDGFDDAIHAEAVRSALNDVGSSSKAGLHHSGWTTSEDEADAMDEDEGTDAERRRSFREHRKAHYDEFFKIKELRRKGSLLEDESEEEIEDKERKEGQRDSLVTAGVKDIDITESSQHGNGS